MTISFVGSHVGTHAAVTAQTVNFSSLLDAAGGTPTLLPGDLVLVAVENASTVNRTLAQLLPGNFWPLHTDNYQDDNNDSNLLVSAKFMGDTVETGVDIPASNATTAGVGYGILVLRGVDPYHPMDATPVVAGAINTGIADPGAITPVTAGAWIVEFCGAAVAAGAVFTRPADLSATTNHFRSATITTTTNDANIGFGVKTDWSSGAFNGAVFGGSTSTNTGSWSAVTLALRPIQSVTLPTLDPKNSNANIIYTDNGLSVDENPLSTVGDLVARATVSKAAGKWYFEATQDSFTGASSVGLCDAACNAKYDGTYLGAAGNVSIGFFSNGNVGVNASFSAITATFGAGDVVRIAFDMDAEKVWLGVNGTWGGDPAAGTGGHTIPFGDAAFPGVGMQGATDGWTVNFGATAFAQSVPTGFSAFNATGISATIAVTDSSDTISISGEATLPASIAAPETSDTAAASATVTTGGAIASTESPDTTSVSGAATTPASIAATESSDTGSIATTVTTGGVLAATEASDTSSITASNWSTAQLAANESSETAAINAEATTPAAIAATEASDTTSITAEVTTGAALAVSEAPDSANITADVWRTAQIAASDGSDSASIDTTVTSGADIAATEAADNTSITAEGDASITSAGIAASESSDTTALTATVTTGAVIAATESLDTASISTPGGAEAPAFNNVPGLIHQPGIAFGAVLEISFSLVPGTATGLHEQPPEILIGLSEEEELMLLLAA